EKLFFLKAHAPGFQDLPNPQNWTKYYQPLSVRPGHVFLEQGKVATNSCWILIKGCIQFWQRDGPECKTDAPATNVVASGRRKSIKERLVGTLTANGLCGSIPGHDSELFTVKALMPCEVYCLSQSALRRLPKDHVDLIYGYIAQSTAWRLARHTKDRSCRVAIENLTPGVTIGHSEADVRFFASLPLHLPIEAFLAQEPLEGQNTDVLSLATSKTGLQDGSAPALLRTPPAPSSLALSRTASAPSLGGGTTGSTNNNHNNKKAARPASATGSVPQGLNLSSVLHALPDYGGTALGFASRASLASACPTRPHSAAGFRSAVSSLPTPSRPLSAAAGRGKHIGGFGPSPAPARPYSAALAKAQSLTALAAAPGSSLPESAATSSAVVLKRPQSAVALSSKSREGAVPRPSRPGSAAASRSKLSAAGNVPRLRRPHSASGLTSSVTAVDRRSSSNAHQSGTRTPGRTGSKRAGASAHLSLKHESESQICFKQRPWNLGEF
ncbi:unnamed protein product, partial [Polarella glacialis]